MVTYRIPAGISHSQALAICDQIGRKLALFSTGRRQKIELLEFPFYLFDIQLYDGRLAAHYLAIDALEGCALFIPTGLDRETEPGKKPIEFVLDPLLLLAATSAEGHGHGRTPVRMP